jgi:DNA polymerase-3 subunit beta
MVATDGRRLALCRAQARTSPTDAGSGASSCIIPTKALQLLLRLAGDPEGAVRVAITDNRVFFAIMDAAEGEGGKKGAATTAAPRAVLSSALVEGTFPPFEDVIPKDQDKKVTASTDELARAVRQASVLTNEESRGVRFAFSAKAKRLKISSRAPEVGESEIEMPLIEMVGDDLEISFNPQFLTEALKAVDEGELKIELKASNKPATIRAGDDFLYVVMPVNLPQ